MTFLTIDKGYENLYEINRSKFICYLSPTKNLEEGLDFVKEIKKKHSDATHNCYAIIGSPESNEIKFSDDGEPGGTAGQPILNVLSKNNLYEITAVVTRYFGGIKLGAGGLVGAYSTATAKCLKKAKIVEKKLSWLLRLSLSYGEYKLFNSNVQASSIKVLDTQYTDIVEISLACPIENLDTLLTDFSQLTMGGGKHTLIEKKYVIYERSL